MIRLNRNVSVVTINLLIALILTIGLTKDNTIIEDKGTKKLKTFSSCKELYEKLESFAKKYEKDKKIHSIFGWGYRRGVELKWFGLSSDQISLESGNNSVSNINVKYSKTNIQVENVDEADIIKTDGNYIYIISNNRVVIIKAYPSNEAKLVSIIQYPQDESLLELYIEKDKLVTLAKKLHYIKYNERRIKFKHVREYYDYYFNYLVTKIYDISNKTNPKLLRKIEFEGDYISSRKIGSFVYLILNYYPHYYYHYHPNKPDSLTLAYKSSVPKMKDAKAGKEDRTMLISLCNRIKYIEPVETPNFLIIASISLDNPQFGINREVVLGASDTIYASLNNIYVANNFYRAGSGIYEKNVTKIYKFAIKNGSVFYKGSGEVFGSPLNQFAMDEKGEYFRIVTQSYNSGLATNVYVLNNNLKVIGKLENLAKTERLHSTRFINNRLYLVTFKNIDPLFVIDLDDPKNPQVLGELKIPGFSDYLHHYDENHLIGIGKDTVDKGNFALLQGLKVAIFDVSDPKSPKEKFVEIIGDRGTETPALRDHKAFLFDKEKNLLVLPVILVEIPKKQKDEKSNIMYGDVTFIGAYVYNLTLKNGFELKGKISHFEEDNFIHKVSITSYGGDPSLYVKRVLYIENILYTISDKKLFAHELDDLKKVADVGY